MEIAEFIKEFKDSKNNIFKVGTKIPAIMEIRYCESNTTMWILLLENANITDAIPQNYLKIHKITNE